MLRVNPVPSTTRSAPRPGTRASGGGSRAARPRVRGSRARWRHIGALSAALTLALAALPGPASAQPALDALCGATLTESLVFEADVDCTRFEGVALTVAADDVTIEGNGYRLLAPDSSHAIQAVDVDRVTVRDLEVQGWCTGVGIALDGGVGHVVDNVIASGRSVGVEARNTSDLTIRALQADAASDVGLSLDGVGLPLTLEDLTLTNNLTGLRLNAVTGPFTFDPGVITDIRGSDTGIHLVNGVEDITFEGLVIDGDASGIDAWHLSHRGLTFRDLDLTGRVGIGEGLRLRGDDHVIEGVVASRRATGVTVSGAANLTVRRLTAAGVTGSALALSGLEAPLTLEELTLVDSGTGLALSGFEAPTGFLVAAWDAASQTGAIASLDGCTTSVSVVNVQNVVFRDLRADGTSTGVHAHHASNRDLTFEGLDVSGPYRTGTGLYISGDGHTVTGLVADLRTTGLYLRNATEAVVRNVQSDGATTGVYILSAALPLDVAELHVRRSGTGLSVENFSGDPSAPFAIGPWDPATDAGIVGDFTGTATGLRLVNAQHLRVHDLDLHGRAAGVHAYQNQNAHIVFEDLDLSGPRLGDGLLVAGANHTIRDVRVSHRRYGVQLSNTGGLVMHDVVATHNTAAGLYWLNMNASHAPPQLARLALTANNRGVYLRAWSLPFTFDATLDIDTAGSLSGYVLYNVDDVTLEGLVLDNPTNGVAIDRVSHRLTFRDLDVSGPGTGTGLHLGTTANTATAWHAGSGHVIDNVVANHRATGVSARFPRDLVIEGLEARHCRTGLSLINLRDVSGAPPMTPPTLAGLDLRDNDVALSLQNVEVPFTFDPSVGLDARGSAVGIEVTGSVGLTFRGLTLDNRDAGIRATTGNLDLTFEDLDLSGHGPGEGLRLGNSRHSTFTHVNNARSGHTVADLVADRRVTGLAIHGADGVHLADVRAHECATGIALSATATPPTLERLDLQRNHTGLALAFIPGTAASPLVIDAVDPVTGAGVIASLADSGTGVHLTSSSHVHFRGLTLDNDVAAIDAPSVANADLVFEHLDLRGDGRGFGVRAYGDDLLFHDVDVSHREDGLWLRYLDGVTLVDVTAHGVSGSALHLRDATTAITLSGLDVALGGTGLTLHSVADDAPLVLDGDAFDAFADNATAVTLVASPEVVVDTAALDLIELSATSFAHPPAPSDPLCETEVVSDLTLTGDLDCSGVIGTALTLAADDVVFDGAGHRVIAPHASVVIAAVGRSGVTIRDVDVSGTRGHGTGLLLNGGAGNTVSGVTADRRATGAELRDQQDLTVSGFGASGTSARALYLVDPDLPLALSGLALTDSAGDGLRLDGLDGDPDATGAPWTLGPSAFASLSRNHTSINLGADVARIRVADLALDGLQHGLHANHAGHLGLVVEDLELTPWRRTTAANYGARVSGDGHTLRRLVAHDRHTGLRVEAGQDLVLTNLTARRAASVGVEVTGVSLPLTLADVTATDSVVGLSLVGFDGDPAAPFSVGPWDPDAGAGVVSDLSGSWTALRVHGARDVVVHDLVLTDGHGLYSVDASHASNARLTFRDLDVSGFGGIGRGLHLRGDDLVVERVVAAGRAIGVYVSDTAGLSVDGLTARGAYSVGLSLVTLAPPLALTALDLAHSTTCLSLSGFTSEPGQRLVIGRWDPDTGLGAVKDFSRCTTGITLSNAAAVDVRDLVLDGTTAGITASNLGNADLLFEDLELPAFLGTGLHLGGADHVVRRVTARGRGTGLYLTGTDGAVVEDAVAEANTYGLRLENAGAALVAPTLDTVSLRDNDRAVRLSAFHSPMTLDATQGLDLAGSSTGLEIINSSSLTVRGLTLDHPIHGISAQWTGNQGHLFEDLDVSGGGEGIGVYLAGSGHTLRRVEAGRRGTGIYGLALDGATLEDVTAGACGTGLRLQSMTPAMAPPALSGVDLRGNDQALYLRSWTLPWVLDADVDVDTSGSRTDLYLYNVNGLTVRDRQLGGRSNGLWANRADVVNLTLANLELSGGGLGYGLALGGSGHLVEDVVASDRQYGVWVNAAAGSQHTLRGVEVTRASVTALHFGGSAATPPVLEALTLRDNHVGLSVTNVQGPWTLDEGAIADESGNRVSVDLGNQDVTDVTLASLALSGATTGVRVTSETSNTLGTNARITLDGLDVTGSCRGTGLALGGEDVLVVDTVIGRRGVGARMRWTGPFTLRDSVVGANVTGVEVVNHGRVLNATVTTHANTSATLLYVSYPNASSSGPLPPTSVSVELPGGAEVRAVQSASLGITSGTITLAEPLSAAPAPGTVVRAPGFDAPRVFIEGSDICANGEGLSVTAGNSVTATGNYWRSSDGPWHGDLNPEGGGDRVSGEWVDFSEWVEVPSDKANPYCNQMPVADAGPDQEVCEGDEVTLDASASYDPDIEPLDFTWTQLAGGAVTLEAADEAIARFIAPAPADPEAAEEVLVFQVRADDGHLYDRDTTEITVLRGNSAPTASAGADQSVDEGDAVHLDGGASLDPEGQPLSYAWTQVGGPAVTLLGADTATPSFTAPLLDVGGGPATETVVLELTVTDVPLPEHCGGPRSHSATVAIVVHNVNQPPVADAGADQEVVGGGVVGLDGAGSADPDGDPLTFQWEQIGGHPVTLADAGTATPSFTSPTAPPAGAEVLTFRLTVDDGFGGTDSDTVKVTVLTDACPEDPDKLEPGLCGCGVPDTDTDGDGTPDCHDACPEDPDKVEPGACGCGVPDTDTDGDGTPDCLDGCPEDPDKVEPGACGCGVPDTDTDGDGTPDCLDGCPEDPDKVEPGACGCGVPDTDTDGDGTPDCLDGCPEDPDKVEPGVCGCGVPDDDTSGDGVADCLSDCTDLPDGTVVQVEVPCGCGDLLGVETCEGGELQSTCDPAYTVIPDAVCEEAPPEVAYGIVYDAAGVPRGTIRCARDASGEVSCDEESGAPGRLLVYDDLYCPGYGAALDELGG